MKSERTADILEKWPDEDKPETRGDYSYDKSD